jgi:methylmalonyl-CoA/ethylmalonyl-CoA epimerase
MVAPDTSISGIAQLHVNVKDLERATRFYRDVVGLPFLFEAPGMSFFRCGEVRLMLGRAEKPELDHPSSIVYFRVGDIDAAHDRLKSQISFESPPHLVHRDARHEMWLAFFHDSEDNLLALLCEKPLA